MGEKSCYVYQIHPSYEHFLVFRFSASTQPDQATDKEEQQLQ